MEEAFFDTPLLREFAQFEDFEFEEGASLPGSQLKKGVS